MKQLFESGQNPSLHEVIETRCVEMHLLLKALTSKMNDVYNTNNRAVNSGKDLLNWGDAGSIAHAVEMLEEAAAALGITVDL